MDVLGEVGVAFGVEVVFDLHFIVLEDFGVALGEHDFLFLCGLVRVADEVQCLLEVVHHFGDLGLVGRQFLFGETFVLVLFLSRCCDGYKKQQKKKNFPFSVFRFPFTHGS